MIQPNRELVARGTLRAVNAYRLPTRHELVAHASSGNVDRLPAERKAVVLAKARICLYLIGKEERGVSISNSVRNLLIKAELAEGEGVSDVLLREALIQVACGNKALPSRATIFEWVKLYKRGGQAALASGHWSRKRKTQGWEAKAVEIYSAPGKPSMAAVARDLVRKRGFDCTVDQVRAYLKALPVHLGERSAGRLGKHLFRQTEAPYVRRDTHDLLPGDIYMADGYRADVYLAHPMTGDIWRPEIMHVIDVKTGFLVGYRIMANEGTYDVMLGWAEIFSAWGHVPPTVYVDNGSGYANRLAADEAIGYYKRAGVQRLTRSIPKNAKGKGNIERYHRVVRDDFLKTWQPQLYCGPDMAKDALDATTREVKAGRLTLPSLAQFVEAYNAWLAGDYQLRPSRDDKKVSRAEAFSRLEPIPPHATAEEIARPCMERVVQRASLRLQNREYGHPDLIGWNRRKVLVEFDVLAHGMVTVREMDGHLICDAPLIKTIGVVSDSLMQDDRQKALAAATARLEKKLLEQKARAGLLIDADTVADGAVLQGPATPLLGNAEDEIKLFDF